MRVVAMKRDRLKTGLSRAFIYSHNTPEIGAAAAISDY